MKSEISQLFVPQGEGDNVTYVFNRELPLQVGSEQEAAKFLIQAFEFWKDKKGVFPLAESREHTPRIRVRYDNDFKGRGDQWELARLFNAVLPTFRQFSWVKKEGGCDCGCWCYYLFPLDMFTLFAEGGPEAVAAEERRLKEEEVKAERQRYEDEVTHALQGAEVSDVIRTGLVEYRAGRGYWDGVKVVSKDLVVSYGPRSEWGNVGGIGKFDEVRVWYKGQVARQEWQWRDRYNPNADRFDLRVGGIGNVTVDSKEGKVEIKVEIQNGDDSRFATYTFEDKEAQVQPVLSTEEQATFEQRFEAEVERVFGAIKALMPMKPRMLLQSGEGTYRQPTIKQRVVHASQGVGAFVTEEQIDHQGTDRQMQCKLFVLGFKDAAAHMVTEDHAYEQRQKVSPVITVVDLTPEKVVINTRSGSKTINLS